MRKRPDPTTVILAFLGSVALGFTAMINAVVAAVALISGKLIGALDGAAPSGDTTVTAAASDAFVVAIAFFALAALEFGAGEFLRRRIRTALIPLACTATMAGELAFSMWCGRFTALDAVLCGCAAFAAWTWWRLPAGTTNVDVELELT